MIPEDISGAIARGDRQAVKAWLNAEEPDVNSFGVDGLPGQAPLGTCVLAAAHSQSKYEARNHLEVARMLVARGATADALGYARLLRSPLVMPITSLNVAGTDEMYAWYDLLIGAGADPNSTSEVLVDGFRCRMSMLSRVCFFFPATALITTEKRLALIKLLLERYAEPDVEVPAGDVKKRKGIAPTSRPACVKYSSATILTAEHMASSPPSAITHGSSFRSLGSSLTSLNG